MEIKGEEIIQAAPDVVWQALNDTEVLRLSIPGCEEIARVSDNELQAKVMIKLGPVRARFAGKVSMSDVRPGQGYTLHFEGQGGAAGFAKGHSVVTLAPDANDARHTQLTYTAVATVGGKLGQIGGRLIEGSAKKLAGEFFAAFAQQLNPQAAAPTVEAIQAEGTSAVAIAPAAAAGSSRTPTGASGSGTSPLTWFLFGAATMAAGVIIGALAFG